MVPGNSRKRRFCRLISTSPLPAAWLVLFTILAVGVPVGSAAGNPGGSTPIFARRWDPDEIRSLPDGDRRVQRELYRQGEYSRRWNLIHQLIGPRHLSVKSRNLLRSRGLGPALFDKDGGGTRLSAADAVRQDTLRVLIIRIGFETNREPHLNTIDPGGDFALEPLENPGPLEVDPPPRDKAFFEAHLQGLSEYYRFMSGGRLHIEGRVLPDEPDRSYKISDIADYGPGANGFWTLESLERLVRDMILKADQETQADGSVNLADYDDNSPFTGVIFVHAGSDWQSDVNGDSPNDAPTFFVTLGDPVELIGSNGDGQPGMMSECSVIPETTNQDDYPGSIAAAFYHEFGHSLGLVDIYSTRTGLPSVGIWDLMDSGTNLPVTMGTVTAENDTVIISATGVLAPSLSVWDKWFLGWLEMGELDGRDGDYRLPAVGVPRDQYWMYQQIGDFNLDYPQAYRAGLSPREYFLLENRWVPANTGETPFNDLRFERDEDTGVILYLAGQRMNAWENSGLYDFFMPPGGVLVWHVNADRIEAGLADNTINGDGDGLRLVEADGIQDIGVLEAYVLGWYGSYLDPFGGVDPSGNPTGFHDLHVQGFPSSRNFDRSWSGLSLTGIRPNTKFSSSVMKFTAAQASVVKSYPYELPAVLPSEAPGVDDLPAPRAAVAGSLTPVTLFNGVEVMIFADGPPDDWSGGTYPASLFGAWSDGMTRWNSLPGKPEGAFQALGAPLKGSPFIRDREDEDGVDLVWGTEIGRIGMTHLPEYQMPSETWIRRVGQSLDEGPVPLVWRGDEPRILCHVHPDSLVLLDGTGNPVGEALAISAGGGDPVTEMHIAGPLPGTDNSDMVAVVSRDGWHLVLQDADGLVGAPAFHPYARLAAEAPAWTALVAAGDAYQLHVFDSRGELGAWRITTAGAVSDLGLVLGMEDPLVAAPAVADVDGDGQDDLVLATALRIHGLRPDGVKLRGFPVRLYDLFPLADTTAIAGPVVVADGTGDGVNEIYFDTNGGHLIGLDAVGRLLPATPLRWGDRRTGGLAVGEPDPGRILWLVSPGGYTGPPLDRQFVNGRVIGLGLAGAADPVARTSEWRGPAGGSFRRGSEGKAADLGPTAPVSAEAGRVVIYPNPMAGDGVTVRFTSAGDQTARVGVYNLEGEQVARADITVNPAAVTEYHLSLPGIASGLYLVRLQYQGADGVETRTLTLAVEK